MGWSSEVPASFSRQPYFVELPRTGENSCRGYHGLRYATEGGNCGDERASPERAVRRLNWQESFLPNGPLPLGCLVSSSDRFTTGRQLSPMAENPVLSVPLAGRHSAPHWDL